MQMSIETSDINFEFIFMRFSTTNIMIRTWMMNIPGLFSCPIFNIIISVWIDSTKSPTISIIFIGPRKLRWWSRTFKSTGSLLILSIYQFFMSNLCRWSSDIPISGIFIHAANRGENQLHVVGQCFQLRIQIAVEGPKSLHTSITIANVVTTTAFSWHRALVLRGSDTKTTQLWSRLNNLNWRRSC